MENLIIDPELNNLIRPLLPDERAGLERNIIKNGCRVPLVVWGNIIVDGHNRYEICKTNNIDFSIQETAFADKEEAKIWIIENQLDRRNLGTWHRIQLALLLKPMLAAKGRQGFRTDLLQVARIKEACGCLPCNNLKRMDGEDGSVCGLGYFKYIFRDGNDVPLACDHWDFDGDESWADWLDDEAEPTFVPNGIKVATDTTKELADIAGVGRRTMARAIKIDKDATSNLKERLSTGEASISQIYNEVKNAPHISLATGNNEWYTPKEYIVAATSVLGVIDLDPASSPLANTVVAAKQIYTIEDDGLEQDWKGNVWLNPPYSAELMPKFATKLAAQVSLGHVKAAIVLVNNATETKWFLTLVEMASAICFPSGRVKFWGPDGSIGAPLQGQALIYIGDNFQSFREAFQTIGWIAIL